MDDNYLGTKQVEIQEKSSGKLFFDNIPMDGKTIHVEIDDEGRPWVALAHNTAGFQEAIIGTFVTGPALYGDLISLPELPLGGNSTLKMS